jgi:hypothetical protein
VTRKQPSKAKGPSEAPPRRWLTRAQTTWTVLLAVCGAVGGFTSFVGPFWPTVPDVHPGTEPSSSDFIAPFVVRNKSALFSMYALTMDCRVRDVIFENTSTKRWARVVVTSDFAFGSMAQPTNLLPGGQRQFPCNAENGIRDLRITVDNQTVTLDTLKGVTVRISARWNVNMIIFGWTRISPSIDFSLVRTSAGMKWLEGEIIR